MLRLTFLTNKLNVSFEIPFNIIFGLLLGPFKGALIALIADTLNLLITSSIATWMWEYAIIPPITAIIAWLFFYLYKLKNNLSTLIISAVFLIVLFTLIGIYVMEVFSNDKNTIRIDNLSKDIRQYFTKQLVLYIIITFSIISSIVFTTFLIFYYKSKKEIYYLLAFIFATICIILILVRWLWGPFAFIQYYNRFIGSKTNKTREIPQYFYFYLTPIILKGLITIPIYTIMLYSLIPVLFKMQKKYNKKGTSYF